MVNVDLFYPVHQVAYVIAKTSGCLYRTVHVTLTSGSLHWPADVAQTSGSLHLPADVTLTSGSLLCGLARPADDPLIKCFPSNLSAGPVFAATSRGPRYTWTLTLHCSATATSGGLRYN